MWVNSVYLVFFLMLLIKNVWATRINCEFELVIFIVYHIVEFVKLRQFLCCGEVLRQFLETLPDDSRQKTKMRIIKDIICHFCDILFYFFLMLYTIKNSDSTRLLPWFLVMIPEGISFIINLCFSRWPDNPCQSLVHLVNCAASFLKSLLILFILLKMDNILSWTWTSILW